MNSAEFSNQFDILFNNISSNQAPGLDDYEKSVFLTKAQEEIVKDYFNPNNNKLGQGFDGSARRQYDFSSLVKIVELNEIPKTILNSSTIDPRSRVYSLPDDYYLEVNNTIVLDNKKVLAGTSINYVQYYSYLNTPYQLPSKRFFWSLMFGNYLNEGIFKDNKLFVYKSEDTTSFIVLKVPNDYTVSIEPSDETSVVLDETAKTLVLSFNMAEYSKNPIEAMSALRHNFESHQLESKGFYKLKWDDVDYGTTTASYYITGNKCYEVILNPRYTISSNTLRYVRRPNPIILYDMTDDGLTIDGKQEEMQCELPEAMHKEILQRAVELAKLTYLGDASSLLVAGNASSTDIGIISQNNNSRES